MARRRTILLTLSVAALLLLAVGILCLDFRSAGAQTAPVNDDDRVFTQIQAGKLWTCGVTKAGYIRCWGHTTVAPVRSDGAGYAEVAGGNNFTCGRRSNGVVNCWSSSVDAIPVPPTVAGAPVTFSAITADQSHVCGILDGQNGQTAGLLQCWTDQASGDSGVALATVPSDLAAATVSTVHAGPFGTCALVQGGADNGKAKCWGRMDTQEHIEPPESLKDTPFADIAVSSNGACGIVRDGTEAGRVKCWGLDFDGEIDDAPQSGTFSSLDMRWGHGCALRTDGGAVCWGASDHEQSPLPEELSGATFSQVSVGQYHSCGILDGQSGQTAGTVRCWGGQNFEIHNADSPATFNSGMTKPYGERDPLPLLSAGPGAIDAGGAHTCATTDDGGAVCWGNTAKGPLSLTSGVRQIATGYDNTCALKSDGSVECWGGDSYKQSTLPDELAQATFSAIASGSYHGCGILDGLNDQTEGLVKCWGLNAYTQAALPDELAQATFSAVVGGWYHSCGTLDGQNGQVAGTVKCWGTPPAGQDKGQAEAPEGTFARIDSGTYHNCGILDGQNGQAEGTVHCWGWNEYGLSTLPAGLDGAAFADVAVGVYHSCGVTEAGRMACWGNVAGTTADFGQATAPGKYRYATFGAVAVNAFHSCAVTTAGEAACWGADAQPTAAGLQVAAANGLIVNTGQADPNPRRRERRFAPRSYPRSRWSLSDTSISENMGASVVHATLDRPSVVPTTIKLTVNPTASSGLFTMPDIALTISPGGQTSNGVAIIAEDNQADQSDRRLTVSGLASIGTCPEQATNSVTLTIIDDDRTRPPPTRQPEPTATPPPTPQPEPTATHTPTPQPEPTATHTPTPQPEPTATHTPTPQPEPTATPTPTPQPEPTATHTPTPQPEPTATHTPTPQPEPTATHTPTPQPEPTATHTPTPQPEPAEVEEIVQEPTLLNPPTDLWLVLLLLLLLLLRFRRRHLKETSRYI